MHGLGPSLRCVVIPKGFWDGRPSRETRTRRVELSALLWPDRLWLNLLTLVVRYLSCRFAVSVSCLSPEWCCRCGTYLRFSFFRLLVARWKENCVFGGGGVEGFEPGWQ